MNIFRPLSVSLAWLAAMFLSLSAIAQPASEGTITYIHNDLLGSPMVATSPAGAVIWREAYTGYGERKNQPADTAQSARAANKVWYTSRHQDEDTGLVYMGARYYDPALGRFLSVDPVHFVETNSHSFNRYAYANNNPYRYKDPDGRFAREAVVATGIFLIGSAIYVTNCEGCKQSVGRAMGALGDLLRGPIRNENAGNEGKTDASSEGGPKIADGNQIPSGKAKDVPNRAEPGEIIEGRRRTREYGPDGSPLRDYDKPHQGEPKPHVHEWENGGREHPGREYSPVPQKGS